MDVVGLTSFISWIVGLVSAYPMVMSFIILVGTLVVVMSVLAPIIVKLTYWTDKDDKIWERISENILFKAILKALGSFSVYIPPKK